MSTFVTVATVTRTGWFENNKTSILILKARLEAEGIECFLQGELRGPTRLQIKGLDVEKAIPILKKTGFYQKEDLPQNIFFENFDLPTSTFPILTKIPVVPRLILMALIIATILCTFIYLIIPRK